MKYSDLQRIAKMNETTGKLLRYIQENQLSEEAILWQEPLRWAITTPLYNIGEHAYQLSAEFKEAHPDVPWLKIAGLRHRLVHDYENTNWKIICNILYSVLPEFKMQLEVILQPEADLSVEKMEEKEGKDNEQA